VLSGALGLLEDPEPAATADIRAATWQLQFEGICWHPRSRSALFATVRKHFLSIPGANRPGQKRNLQWSGFVSRLITQGLDSFERAMFDSLEFIHFRTPHRSLPAVCISVAAARHACLASLDALFYFVALFDHATGIAGSTLSRAGKFMTKLCQMDTHYYKSKFNASTEQHATGKTICSLKSRVEGRGGNLILFAPVAMSQLRKIDSEALNFTAFL